MDAQEFIDAIQSVTADTLADLVTFAADTDFVAMYDTTKEDDEPTDLSGELGDALEALYWYLNDCHEGQWSVSYQALCRVSEVYTPGRCSTCPEPDSMASMYYDNLLDVWENN